MQSSHLCSRPGAGFGSDEAKHRRPAAQWARFCRPYAILGARYRAQNLRIKTARCPRNWTNYSSIPEQKQQIGCLRHSARSSLGLAISSEIKISSRTNQGPLKVFYAVEEHPCTTRRRLVMGKLIAFLYGLVAYVVFCVAVLYAIGFVTGLFVPKTIDSGPVGSPV